MESNKWEDDVIFVQLAACTRCVCYIVLASLKYSQYSGYVFTNADFMV